MPVLGVLHARACPRSVKGLVTTATVSAPGSPRAISATIGAAPGAGAAAHAGGDEDHVGALRAPRELLAVSWAAARPMSGLRAGAQTLGELAADLDLTARGAS